MIASLAMDVMRGRSPLTGAVVMEVCATFEPAKSWSKKRKLAALSGQKRPTGKPDLDNIAKLAWDALNGIVYADDSQVTALQARKVYGETAETVIIVRELPS